MRAAIWSQGSVVTSASIKRNAYEHNPGLLAADEM
jgi:hypothetical protein